MRIGYNWLREYVEIDMDPNALAESLSMLGFPVESIGASEPEYPGIVTGQVLEVQKHPRADRLVVCDVAIAGANLHIVCGATNVRKGMKVPVACVGSVLPGRKSIERVTIRGETSEGMLCSGAELGLSDDAAGIMELPAEARVGITLDEQLGVGEIVLDLEISHNRPDCLSVFGIAREISALTGAKLKFPEARAAEETARPDESVSVRVEDAEDCPRYCGRVLSGVKIALSPVWLRRRLQIAGFRALNNVVDCTNYCLASFGQPIHSFDLDRVKTRSILVRRGRTLERIVTLDGVTRMLGPGVLLITDGQAPIAIAGIMGGQDTEVSDGSKRLFLESATFSAGVVNGGSKKLGLETEASQRFSHGVDPKMADTCLEYASWLISSLSGGVCKGQLVDRYGLSKTPIRIQVNPERMNRVLGGCVGPIFMKEKLSALGFNWHENPSGVEVEVPSFRHDVHEEIDVVEEVARSYGYDKFPDRAANLSSVPGVDEDKEVFLETCADYLFSIGLSETISRVIVDPKKATMFLGKSDGGGLTTVLNPASSAEAVLRPSILCGLLDAVSLNLRRGAGSVRFFEIGKTFHGVGEERPEERYAIAAAICGPKRAPSWQEVKQENCDIFDIKGVAEMLLAKLKVDNYWVLCYDGPVVAGDASGSIFCNDKMLGSFGLVCPELLRTYDIERDVYVFELDAEILWALCKERNRFEEPSRFPPVKRDIAVIVDGTLVQGEIAKFIEGISGPDLRRIELFDVYAGEAIERGKKSLAYSLSFQSAERTLSDVEIGEIMERIVTGLEARGAHVRRRTSGQSA